MKQNILAQINSKRSRAEAAEIGITDRVYQAMMEDARDEIRSKAVSEARMGVQGELSAAQTLANTARAEAATTEAKLARSEALVARTEAKLQGALDKIERVTEKNKGLEKIVKLEQGTLTAKDLEYKNEISQLKAELRTASAEKRDLELANAKLLGKIEAAPARKVVKKAAKADPKFRLENVTRDSLNNISGAEIRIVRSN
jgi:hypothetical protein